MYYNTRLNDNINNYANNGGGSSTMKKKYGSKFNKLSSKSNFSINGNGHHSYIGNPNSNFTHDPFSNSSNILLCKTNDNTIKTSVKNTKGLLQTRISNNQLKANPVNSFKCYLDVNKELKDIYDNAKSTLDLTNCDASCNIQLGKAGLNKHFINKDASTKTAEKKCFVDRTGYIDQLLIAEKINCNKSNVKAKCNITKDLKEVNAYIPSYDIYMLKKKNACNYNPRDEFNRGKEATTSIKLPYPNCN